MALLVNETRQNSFTSLSCLVIYRPRVQDEAEVPSTRRPPAGGIGNLQLSIHSRKAKRPQTLEEQEHSVISVVDAILSRKLEKMGIEPEPAGTITLPGRNGKKDLLKAVKKRFRSPRPGDEGSFTFEQECSVKDFDALQGILSRAGRIGEYLNGKLVIKEAPSLVHEAGRAAFMDVFSEMMTRCGTKDKLENFLETDVPSQEEQSRTKMIMVPDMSYGPVDRVDTGGWDWSCSTSTVVFEVAWANGTVKSLEEKMKRYLTKPSPIQIFFGIVIQGYDSKKPRQFPTADTDCAVIYGEKGTEEGKLKTRSDIVKMGAPVFSSGDEVEWPGYPTVILPARLLFEGVAQADIPAVPHPFSMADLVNTTHCIVQRRVKRILLAFRQPAVDKKEHGKEGEEDGEGGEEMEMDYDDPCDPDYEEGQDEDEMDSEGSSDTDRGWTYNQQ